MKSVLCLLLLTAVTFGADLSGKVVGVHDGDSFTLLVNKEQKKIRLHGIDAPELGQAFGKKAKQALAARIHGKHVRVAATGQDQWKRITGDVFLGKQNVNLWMVEQGYAHWFSQYSGNKALQDAQTRARKGKRGLWKETNVQTPDQWRKARKKAAALRKIKESGTAADKAVLKYWLNTTSGVRHNQSCRWYGKTKRGRSCGSNDGKPCSKCGG